MNRGKFMSKYNNFSILLEAGTKTILDNGKVDRKPSQRAQFKNGMFDPHNCNLDMKPKEIIEKMMAEPGYESDFWLIDTKSIMTPKKIVDSSYRDLTDKDDGLLQEIDDPTMLREAVKLEKKGENSTGDTRKTVLKVLRKRLEEILDKFSKELEDEEK
jgi:hypothetical protein